MHHNVSQLSTFGKCLLFVHIFFTKCLDSDSFRICKTPCLNLTQTDPLYQLNLHCHPKVKG